MNKKIILVKKLDESKNEILEIIQSLKNSNELEKQINLDLDSTTGKYNDALLIASDVLENGIKINATGKGSMDSSAAILFALSKRTGGTSSVFFSADFKLAEKAEKSEPTNSAEIRNENILKALKHLKCNSELLKDIFQSGEIISAEKAKECGIVKEIQNLPTFNKIAGKKNKKAGKSSAGNISLNSATSSANTPVSNNISNTTASADQINPVVLESEKDKPEGEKKK
jgi:ATP-dependent protease ClpP protease subunit